MKYFPVPSLNLTAYSWFPQVLPQNQRNWFMAVYGISRKPYSNSITSSTSWSRKPCTNAKYFCKPRLIYPTCSPSCCLCTGSSKSRSPPWYSELIPVRYWQVPYYWIGCKMYDMLAGKENMETSYLMTKGKALEAFPMLKSDGLVGALVYYDGKSVLLQHLWPLSLRSTRSTQRLKDEYCSCNDCCETWRCRREPH